MANPTNDNLIDKSNTYSYNSIPSLDHKTQQNRYLRVNRLYLFLLTQILSFCYEQLSLCSVAYPLQKFDSDSERRFSVILERNADKWFRPAKGQFQVFYKSGSEQPEYVPDFVAESADKIYMAETKARSDLADADVQAKAEAAVKWCQHATEYTLTNGGKPWVYLMKLMMGDDWLILKGLGGNNLFYRNFGRPK